MLFMMSVRFITLQIEGCALILDLDKELSHESAPLPADHGN